MATNSRYDFMKESTVEDSVIGSFYPDPLTLNYTDLRMTETPSSSTMTDERILYLWDETEERYGTPSWDDMVLTLNGIAHRNFLRSGDVLYFPKLTDMTGSFAKDRM